MLAGPLRARLVASGAGIWVFTWNRPRDLDSLVLPGVPALLPGWVTPGPVGRDVTRGPSVDWELLSTARSGYVLAHDYWREPAGSYQATVTLSASGEVSVEVWDTTANLLIARRQLPRSNGLTTLTIPFAQAATWARAFDGSGPFRIQTLDAPAHDELEVRVWSPASTTLKVKSVGIQPSGVGR